MSKVKIMLVDDHEVVRVGLAALLERKAEFEIVAQASSGQEAVKKAAQHEPDVILLDIRMPSGSGIDACREICDKHPDTKVVMLSSYTDDEVIVKSIMAGACGYILKEINSQELIKAVEAVNRGESLLDPKITQKVLEHMRKSNNEDEKEDKLTEREEAILEFLAEGLTNREIAKKVHLAEKTVRNYVSKILKKLDLNNRVEAATYITKKKMRQQNKYLEL
ncbi:MULTISPECIES: response regulator [unclassified Candidatus Frackibacter]|uniref:response regulator n=1 Tax=unclassified Candidatus Frackibacter TaxID=2648818 RepID=UPI0008821382|nr:MULTISPECIES: response regulator transcription factor [unclassified Candidatus Frackibacter]SDC11423.1 DNA-binding response regulator, NarL/FixJ family, contains REC and HTH domains [Candidatus Frackibacter sp. WG11]SEM36500.1 DNA-binding response regulator, NarL/FixJ family, contains REC and HTH domains [Candidatus Frackibacter sp. WG12]SFL41784.1 DNA-binding response regulator, NarL/FixJ family, contains REC and HTH domains [Candidatus Frackibacter sp. WG13]